MPNNPKIRRSIREMQHDYDSGIPEKMQPMEDLLKAWQGIQNLDTGHENSFFNLGGYHGEPFRGPGVTNAAWWGGYCNHQNVLFPTWHRIYCYKLEKALQSIPGCEDVTLPYWDQTDGTTDVPSILTQDTAFFDGREQPNPLKSYTIPVQLLDLVDNDTPLDYNYAKYAGYTTVRYPLSGLVDTQADQYNTNTYNATFSKDDQDTMLNNSIKAMLPYYDGPDPPQFPGVDSFDNVAALYKMCLAAPNYTVFSNTQSYAQFNIDNPNNLAAPLENPHNWVHCHVGGVGANPDIWGNPRATDANGDMGENNTAAFDPIFYFHHCNIDRMFWIWQKIHGATDHFDIVPNYPGTIVKFGLNNIQGPAAGQWDNWNLTMDTPLTPFNKLDQLSTPYASRDAVNIETQLGYTYSIGSLDPLFEAPAPGAAAHIAASPHAQNVFDAIQAPIAIVPGKSAKKLFVSGLSKANIKGSFVIKAYITIEGKRYLLGRHVVFSRRNSLVCENCKNYLDVDASFHLNQFTDEQLNNAVYDIELHGKERMNKDAFGKFRALAATEFKPYSIEVK